MKKTTIIFSFMFLLVGFTYGQRMIKGSILDKDGVPLIGANVLAIGSSVGTITDFDGSFTLNVPESVSSLEISYTGYENQVVDIAGKTVVSITLLEGRLLDEVVVTALGIKKSEKSLGYSATTINSEEITQTRNNSFADAISGKVAGVSISSNGSPGGSTSIVMRGYSSATGNNEALIVIDGVPILNASNRGVNQTNNSADDFNRSQDFGTQVNDINPDDIQSLTVLKGAAATALYGSSAANGAIIITTKSGSFNQGVQVDYSGSVFQSQVNRTPHLQNTFGQGWNGLWATNENGSWGPKADGKDRLWGNTVNNARQLKPYTILEDNLRDFYDYGFGFNNSVSISGGNENAAFRVSYANAQEDGIVPTDVDSYNLNTIGVNGKLKSGKFTIGTNVTFSNKAQKAIATGQGDDAGAGGVLFQEIIQIPRDHSIVDYKDYNSVYNNLDNFYTPYAQNPYFTLNEQGNNYNEDRVRGSMNLGYDILENLKAQVTLGGDISNSNLQDWGNLANITPGSPNSTANNVVGRFSTLSAKNSTFNTDFLLSYNRKLTSDFGVRATVGANVFKQDYQYNSSYITNLTIPGFYSLSNSTEDPRASDFKREYRKLGVYGVLDFDYRDWLYLTLQARNDWSSTLPSENNSFFYPAATLSAVLTDVLELDRDIFNYIKVRASYAQAGNDAKPYQIFPVFTTAAASGGFATTQFPIAGISAFEKGDVIGNENLQPEISSEWEIGGDFRFFDNRIGLDVAYFNKLSNNQIISKELDPSSGFTAQTVNLGEISNKGIELLLNLVPVKTKDFKWDLTANYTKVENIVKSIGEASADGNSIVVNTAYGVELRVEEGKPIGAVYAPTAMTDPNGNIVVNDANGLPLDAAEKKYMGSINPDFTLGFGTSLTYKNFKLSTNFDYRKGGVFYSYTARLNYFVGNAWNSQYNDREPFVVPGSVNVSTNDEGQNVYNENITQVNRSDIFTYWGATTSAEENHVLDRTFIKMRNLSLEYSIPQSFCDRLSINRGASVSVFGRNLFLWTPDNNHYVDPELTTFGVGLGSQIGEFAGIPTSATYGFTLKLSI